MSKPALATLLITCLISSAAAQKFEYTKQAHIDFQGGIYVSSDEGKLIKMADGGHCGEAIVADDKQTVVCFVSEGSQLEIYLKGGKREVIEPGAPIREWHFWEKGRQVTIYSGPRDGSVAEFAPETIAWFDEVEKATEMTLSQ